MNEARAHSILAGQSSLARKVYEAVPIAEPWSLNSIMGEVLRLGHNVTHNNMRGCLRDMVEAGLVREPYPLQFIREKVTVKKAKTMPMPSAQLPTSTSPADFLADAAVSLRAVATGIEEVALKLAEDSEKTAETMKAFEAFRQLMKGMS